MIPAPLQPKSLLLEIPNEIALTVTPKQFAALAAANRDLRLERTKIGHLIVNPPTGSESGKRNAKIATQLGVWGEANEQLGEYFDSSTGFELPNGANRSPDASWIRKERWDALTPEQRKGFAPLCPDFVLELRSETDSLNDLREKMQEYMENGARLGWLIDPHNKRVEIYRIGQAVEVLENPRTLSGETVLPRFTLTLKRIWD
ncbi:Uma2 family endonuclease [Crocosphaera sp.]|uniref:Uma2 family endonuclease n=1 Tax=Crocosphaera sp. TaxID=2729996 RepID=UPI002634F84F|nr:Uma2 family endonuclease [Crocosphaera sp.]MDJ0582895.1 Uma2 family endonuclease [Crocosphaera sp.]